MFTDFPGSNPDIRGFDLIIILRGLSKRPNFAEIGGPLGVQLSRSTVLATLCRLARQPLTRGLMRCRLSTRTSNAGDGAGGTYVLDMKISSGFIRSSRLIPSATSEFPDSRVPTISLAGSLERIRFGLSTTVTVTGAESGRVMHGIIPSPRCP